MVPLAVAICRQSMRAADSSGGAPGSAITTAVGLTETKAVGASAHVVSMVGKAPAATSASTRSVAGLSATTIIGPCSDMGARGYSLRAHDLVRKPVPTFRDHAL